MRILLFGNAASPNVRSFVAGLRDVGSIDVVVASFEPGGDVTLRRRGRGALRYVLAAHEAASLRRRTAPDLTLGYFASGYGTLARLSGGRPLVTACVGSDLLRQPMPPSARRMTGATLRASDLVLAWSHELGSAAQSVGVDATRILVQCRGVDRDLFHPPEEPPARRTIVSTRSLEAKYRHEVLLAALSQLEGPWSASVVGDGSERKRLELLAAEALPAGALRFLGRLPPAELASVLTGHSIYASTSPTDGVSASLLEAMACGLLPVVADNSANREWVDHGVNGLLHAGEADDLAAQLARALSDDDLLAAARERNLSLIAERADLRRNSAAIAAALLTVL